MGGHIQVYLNVLLGHPPSTTRPSNTWSSHHPHGAPPNDTYPPYFATGPRACYNKDSVCYGGARDTYGRTSHPSGSCDQALSLSCPCSPHGPDSSLEYHCGHTGIPNDSAQFLADIGFQDTDIQNKIMRLFRHIRQSWYNRQYNSFGPQKESILKSTAFFTRLLLEKFDTPSVVNWYEHLTSTCKAF